MVLGGLLGLVVLLGATVLGSAVLTRLRGEATAALWVWHEMPPDELVSLAADHEVGRLLVWVAPGFSTDPATSAWVRELRGVAGAHDIALDALGGDPQWAVRPGLAGSWASEVAATGWFERLHLDVEPHALEQWQESSASLLDGLVAAVRAAARAGLPVDADVPYWLDTVRTTDGDDGLTAICGVASSVTVMAYQDRVEAIERVAAATVDAGRSAGIPVWVGVNLSKPVDDAPSSSLWGAGAAEIARVLSRVPAMPGVAGVAIHDADALAALDSGA